jgi:hypothetical protein
VAIVRDLLTDALTVNLTQHGLLHPGTGNRGAGGRVRGPVGVRVLRSRGTGAHVRLPPDTLFRRGAAKSCAVIARDEVQRCPLG